MASNCSSGTIAGKPIPGVTQFYAGNERWLAGTPGGGADLSLIDDGVWHHYVIHLTRSGAANLWPTAVHFKMEDWIHSDGVAGNAWFDNIGLTDVAPGATDPVVPEPASLALLATGVGAFVCVRRRP